MIDTASDTLKSAFAALAEATTPAATPVYGPITIKKLAGMIVGRAYAKPLRELCHLVVLADAAAPARGSYVNFFVDGAPATAPVFRARVAAAAKRGFGRARVRPTESGVALAYADGVFAIAYGRMPLLAALLEFVQTALSFAAVEEALAPLLDGEPSMAAADRAASDLARRLYRYLGDHLPTKHALGKFDAILKFLDGRRASGAAALAIDDADVLAYWQAYFDAPEDADGDFRNFRTVFESFVDFIRAVDLAAARTRRGFAKPIGLDADRGEIDPGAIGREGDVGGADAGAVKALDDAFDAWRSPLAALDEEPAARIKFLNKSERALVALPIECGPEALKLPLSLLRAEIFGAAQAAVQHVLRHRDPARTAAACACDGAETYPERVAGYATIDQHVERMVKAAAFAVLRRPANVVAFAGATQDDDARLAAVFTEAERAFKGTARQGFDRTKLDDPDHVEGFRCGSEALIALREQLARYLKAVAAATARAGGPAPSFAADRAVFGRAFRAIYMTGAAA
ncbi:MAG: hypothetical protein FJX67_19015 [Alphaproteobacteria bacterium]|nr:hypothetical protein [Alphaproteobacteria bacterium]